MFAKQMRTVDIILAGNPGIAESQSCRPNKLSVEYSHGCSSQWATASECQSDDDGVWWRETIVTQCEDARGAAAFELRPKERQFAEALDACTAFVKLPHVGEAVRFMLTFRCTCSC
jgi:hypothetical protein